MGCAASCGSQDNEQFLQHYTMSTELGKGHFATVRLCKHKKTGEQFAVKIMNKKRMSNPTYMRDEVDILRKVGDHRHCVKLYNVFEDAQSFYLVMELCSGGDLFSRIVEYGNYSEKEASESMRQLGAAIYHIHSKGITHRDLKPENILLASKKRDADIKVADFGLSKLISGEGDVMKTICGTWAYCAPEVIEQKAYDQRVDNWTLGVLMFILLSGYHPFDEYGDLSEPELLEKIIACDYNFDDPVWEEISDAPKSIIQKLLKVDPDKRLSLKDFCQHSWIRGSTARSKALPSVIQRMQSFNQSRRMRGSVLSHVSKTHMSTASTVGPSDSSISGIVQRHDVAGKVVESGPAIAEEDDEDEGAKASVPMNRASVDLRSSPIEPEMLNETVIGAGAPNTPVAHPAKNENREDNAVAV